MSSKDVWKYNNHFDPEIFRIVILICISTGFSPHVEDQGGVKTAQSEMYTI